MIFMVVEGFIKHYLGRYHCFHSLRREEVEGESGSYGFLIQLLFYLSIGGI